MQSSLTTVEKIINKKIRGLNRINFTSDCSVVLVDNFGPILKTLMVLRLFLLLWVQMVPNGSNHVCANFQEMALSTSHTVETKGFSQ